MQFTTFPLKNSATEMVCGNVLTGQQREVDGSIKHIFVPGVDLFFLVTYLPSQNSFLLKMAIPEKGAAIQGPARLAK